MNVPSQSLCERNASKKNFPCFLLPFQTARKSCRKKRARCLDRPNPFSLRSLHATKKKKTVSSKTNVIKTPTPSTKKEHHRAPTPPKPETVGPPTPPFSSTADKIDDKHKNQQQPPLNRTEQHLSHRRLAQLVASYLVGHVGPHEDAHWNRIAQPLANVVRDKLQSVGTLVNPLDQRNCSDPVVSYRSAKTIDSS